MSDNIQDPRIRIATTDPKLKDKIHTHLTGNTEFIYWYIRFNIALDSDTVSHKSMGVTDTSGYIMRTDIAYDTGKNRIVISPLDTYEENRYYLLRISRKVRSKRGQRLKAQINILFKLLNHQISEYKVLRQEVKLPPAMRRPPNYDVVHTRSKVYSTDGKEITSIKQDKLPMANLHIKVLPGLIGLALAIGSVYYGNTELIIASVLVCAAGLAYMFRQLALPENRSIRIYNKGAKKFNRGKYSKAKELFQRANALDGDNEYAEYAVYKVEFFL